MATKMERMVIHCRQWRILNASNGANGTPHHYSCQWLLSLAPLMIAIDQHWCHLNGDNGDVAARIVIKRKGHHWRQWWSIGDQWRQWLQWWQRLGFDLGLGFAIGTIIAIVTISTIVLMANNGDIGDPLAPLSPITPFQLAPLDHHCCHYISIVNIGIHWHHY